MMKEKLKILPFLLLLFYYGITKLFKDLSFEKKMIMLLPIIIISLIIYIIQYKNNPAENKKTKFYIFFDSAELHSVPTINFKTNLTIRFPIHSLNRHNF